VLLLGIGVCLLFSGTYRRAGWFLVWASSAAVGVGVLHSLFISFRPTTLWSLATMVVMIAAGGGLAAAKRELERLHRELERSGKR
jgi:VanZ family protein